MNVYGLPKVWNGVETSGFIDTAKGYVSRPSSLGEEDAQELKGDGGSMWHVAIYLNYHCKEVRNPQFF